MPKLAEKNQCTGCTACVVNGRIRVPFYSLQVMP